MSDQLKNQRKNGGMFDGWLVCGTAVGLFFLSTLSQLCRHHNVRYVLRDDSKLFANAYPLSGAKRLGRAGQRCSPKANGLYTIGMYKFRN